MRVSPWCVIVTERSHSDLVRMMLPLFGKYVYVQRFVHNQYLYERGMCNQALASALQSLLKVSPPLVTTVAPSHD